jgi:hypothetical protein
MHFVDGPIGDDTGKDCRAEHHLQAAFVSVGPFRGIAASPDHEIELARDFERVAALQFLQAGVHPRIDFCVGKNRDFYSGIDRVEFFKLIAMLIGPVLEKEGGGYAAVGIQAFGPCNQELMIFLGEGRVCSQLDQARIQRRTGGGLSRGQKAGEEAKKD